MSYLQDFDSTLSSFLKTLAVISIIGLLYRVHHELGKKRSGPQGAMTPDPAMVNLISKLKPTFYMWQSQSEYQDFMRMQIGMLGSPVRVSFAPAFRLALDRC
jgi:hypothetical protein